MCVTYVLRGLSPKLFLIFILRNIHDSQKIVLENGTISNVSPHLTKNTKASSFKRKASLSVTSNDKPKDENIAEGPLVNILDCLKVSFDEISTPLRKKPLRPLKSLACEFCDKVCLNRKRLNHHVRIVHSNFRYTCDICSKEYKNKGTLDMHKKTHSGGSENYVCDMCNFTTPWKTSMTIHRRRHLGKTSFQCDLCDKAYYKKCELEQHKYVHNTSKPYQCDVCGASYMQKHTLWQHTQSKHSADAPQFPCPHCGRLYIFKSKLKSHIKTHLGFRPTERKVES
uniref:C2H2-type domain-containing protein n=1 Tax=Timema cristinae TaxID=61476 RepID=A0A7R9CBT9_TIMCR|nr:unnamed protein product [Timema cristinae]